jgi:hypothetical protein
MAEIAIESTMIQRAAFRSRARSRSRGESVFRGSFDEDIASFYKFSQIFELREASFFRGLKALMQSEVHMSELKSLCENGEFGPSAAKAALNGNALRHG